MRFLSSDPAKRGKGTELAALMTFIVSAIWHGFYPGYIVFFFWIFVLDLHEKTARKVVPKFAYLYAWVPQKLQNAFVFCFYMYGLGYFHVSFVTMYVDVWVAAFNEVYWFFHIITVVSLVFLKMNMPKKTKQVKKD